MDEGEWIVTTPKDQYNTTSDRKMMEPENFLDVAYDVMKRKRYAPDCWLTSELRLKMAHDWLYKQADCNNAEIIRDKAFAYADSMRDYQMKNIDTTGKPEDN